MSYNQLSSINATVDARAVAKIILTSPPFGIAVMNEMRKLFVKSGTMPSNTGRLWGAYGLDKESNMSPDDLVHVKIMLDQLASGLKTGEES